MPLNVNRLGRGERGEGGGGGGGELVVPKAYRPSQVYKCKPLVVRKY